MIRYTVDAYRALYEGLGRHWMTACRDGLRWLERDVFEQWPHLGDELQATAASAGVAPGEVAFVWCRSELLGAAGMYGGECTSAARAGVIGQTWDWHPSFAGTLEARVVSGPHGPVLIAGEAGQPAKLGVNSSGVWVGLNWLAGSRPVAAGDIPVHVAIRSALEASTSATDAADRLSRVPLAQAAAFPIQGPDGSMVVERHPSGAAGVVRGGELWSVHANHPDDVRVDAAQGFDPWAGESRDRAGRLALALEREPADASSLARALTVVAYDADPGDPPADRIATLAAAVSVPADGWLVLCPTRPSAGAPATAYNIDGSVLQERWGAFSL